MLLEPKESSLNIVLDVEADRLDALGKAELVAVRPWTKETSDPQNPAANGYYEYKKDRYVLVRAETSGTAPADSLKPSPSVQPGRPGAAPFASPGQQSGPGASPTDDQQGRPDASPSPSSGRKEPSEPPKSKGKQAFLRSAPLRRSKNKHLMSAPRTAASNASLFYP
ncbi:hypothetical protein LJK87_17790 [Paenibacillus sp. P25]|nr:hypothetical protein LJK87_17790 [Paenibacillus sp. P25]